MYDIHMYLKSQLTTITMLAKLLCVFVHVLKLHPAVGYIMPAYLSIMASDFSVSFSCLVTSFEGLVHDEATDQAAGHQHVCGVNIHNPTITVLQW